MAQRIQTLWIDDLDGSEAEGTVRFGLDGASYEIDLNKTNTDALRGTLAKYVEAGRIAAGQKVARGRRADATDGRKANLVAAREYLRLRPVLLDGRTLNDRGRMPKDLQAKVPDAVLFGGMDPSTGIATTPPISPTPATTNPEPPAGELDGATDPEPLPRRRRATTKKSATK